MAQILTNAPQLSMSATRLPPLSRLAFGFAATVLAWETRRHGRNALRQMEPHLLKDIGLTIQDATVECEKPFWRG